MSQYEEVLTASNVKGNITIESHHINIDHLMKEIYTKKDRHMAAYGKNAKIHETADMGIQLDVRVLNWLYS